MIRTNMQKIKKEDWEDDYWKIVHEKGCDYDLILGFISSLLSEKKGEWEDKFLNQPANQHDQAVREFLKKGIRDILTDKIASIASRIYNADTQYDAEMILRDYIKKIGLISKG